MPTALLPLPVPVPLLPPLIPVPLLMLVLVPLVLVPVLAQTPPLARVSPPLLLVPLLLAPLPMPVYVIPGNHDARDPLRRVFGIDGYLPREGPYLHYVVEHYPVRLVGLDTLVPGHSRTVRRSPP